MSIDKADFQVIASIEGRANTVFDGTLELIQQLNEALAA